MLVRRTPPWQTREEREAIMAFYRDARNKGMTVDHIVPFNHPALAGLHVLANLQHLSLKDNMRKGNRLPETEGGPAEYVRRGMAVWRRDVGDDGRVDWQRYALDRELSGAGGR